MTVMDMKAKTRAPQGSDKRGRRQMKQAPMFGQGFTLNATASLDEARWESRRAAAQMRRNRVNSRNAQNRMLIAALTKFSKG